MAMSADKEDCYAALIDGVLAWWVDGIKYVEEIFKDRSLADCVHRPVIPLPLRPLSPLRMHRNSFLSKLRGKYIKCCLFAHVIDIQTLSALRCLVAIGAGERHGE